MTKSIRAFIAFELSEELRGSLAAFIWELRSGLSGVRWVDPSDIHLTLKFLGNIPPTQVDDIGSALAETAQRYEPFVIRLGQVGAFPAMRAPTVIWIGISEGADTVVAFQRQVEEALASSGFSPEGRPFTPHLTLGRVRRQTPPKDRWRVAKALSASHPPSPVAMKVEAVSLMRSILTPSGALYQRVLATPLGSQRE